LKRLFIYGSNGKIATADNKGNIKYVINDQLGSASVITDEEGNELARYKYSPFGNLIKSKGEIEESYRFTGKEFDKLTGLYYYGARYYNPTIGRFISEDPVKEGWNWYVYTSNNPLRYVDSNGLLKKDKVFSGVVQGVGGFGQTAMGVSITSGVATAPIGGWIVGHGASNMLMGGLKTYNGLIEGTPIVEDILPQAAEVNLMKKYVYQKALGKKWGSRIYWAADMGISAAGTLQGGKELLGNIYGYPFARKGGEISIKALKFGAEVTNKTTSLSKLTIFGLINDMPGYKMQWENKPEFNLEYGNYYTEYDYEYNYYYNDNYKSK